MPVKFKLTDDQLKDFLKQFFSALKTNPNLEEDINRRRSLAEHIRNKILTNEFIQQSEEDFIQTLYYDYVVKLWGPVKLVASKTKIGRNIDQLKDNLTYLLESEDDPFKKYSNLIDGERKIKYFSSSFWSPLIQARYPDKMPNINNRTEKTLEVIGDAIIDKEMTEYEKAKRIAEAFQHLSDTSRKLNILKTDFFSLDLLMDFYAKNKEAKSYVDKILGISSIDDDEKEESSFEGFSEATFKTLKKLNEDTSYQTVMKIKDEIHQNVINPFKKLFKCIAERFDLENNLKLEKTKGIISKLWKVNPKSGAYNYLWGAFYPALSSSKIKTIQFWIVIDHNGLTFGVYPCGDIYKKKMIDNLKIVEEEYRPLYKKIIDEYNFYLDNYIDGKRESIAIKKYDDLYQSFEKYRLDVGQFLNEKETIQQGSKLVELITKTFEDLIPFYLLGKSDDINSALSDYYGKLYDNVPEDFETEFDQISKKDFLANIFLEEWQFDDILEMLESTNKKQIILQGPPGTGKTFIAKNIARFLAKSSNRIETIQFHPSYSYEDFIEGYRPGSTDGFQLKNGIFKTFCDEARKDRDSNYILTIDEINRGNLSKIFGELMYLLEYRNETVRLTYSGEDFSIPKNLIIIGTMNTADRSLAIMDYALRRRFYFIDLECNTERLEKWLLENGCLLLVKKLIDDIENINKNISEELNSKDFAIGHSYFMKKNLDKDMLDLILRYEIQPLLMEYFYDKPDKPEKLLEVIYE